MSALVNEAERLRLCRRVFERASADRVDMVEAKRRLRAERWADAERRLAEKRCGTRDPRPLDPPTEPRPEQWWQR